MKIYNYEILAQNKGIINIRFFVRHFYPKIHWDPFHSPYFYFQCLSTPTYLLRKNLFKSNEVQYLSLSLYTHTHTNTHIHTHTDTDTDTHTNTHTVTESFNISS